MIKAHTTCMTALRKAGVHGRKSYFSAAAEIGGKPYWLGDYVGVQHRITGVPDYIAGDALRYTCSSVPPESSRRYPTPQRVGLCYSHKPEPSDAWPGGAF